VKRQIIAMFLIVIVIFAFAEYRIYSQVTYPMARRATTYNWGSTTPNQTVEINGAIPVDVVGVIGKQQIHMAGTSYTNKVTHRRVRKNANNFHVTFQNALTPPSAEYELVQVVEAKNSYYIIFRSNR
jgi:hypothetical protein